MNQQILLKVKNLKKIYNNQIVLDIDSLSFNKSHIYAIVGPNGSGKTTLINTLNLLEKPDEGQIFFEGKDIIKTSNITLLRVVEKKEAA